MSEFDKIIKEKIDRFDVPYSEAHWNSMSQKLDAIRRVKIIRKSVISIISVAVVVVGCYFAFQQPDLAINEDVVTVATIQPILNNATITNSEINNEREEGIQFKNIDNNVEKLMVEGPIENNEIIEEKNKSNVEVKPIEANKNNLIIQETISADFDVRNNKTCLGGETVLEAKEKKEFVSYFWDFGDGTSSTKQNPKHQYKNAGTYTITLTVINTKNEEEVKAVRRNLVQIYPLPNTDFTYSELSTQFDDNKLKYPNTNFYYKGELTNTCDWFFGNGDVSNENNPSVLFDKKGDYLITLNSRNEFGCINSITKAIQISNSFELYAPNAFTPNYDGNNDGFMPEALQTWDIKFEMLIKNKSGNIIYRTNDNNAAWKGSLNNQGSILDEGLYFWQVITYDVDGNPYQHMGKVTLIK